MTINTTTQDTTTTIHLNERLDFSQQAEFRKAYEGLPKSNRFIVNFSKAQHIDSAALGMLLLLRDYAGGDHANIELVNCQNEIRNILRISNFDQLFIIK